MSSVIDNIYESGKVVRYHANPWLSIFQQTDADHAWGCAALLCYLHPNPRAELVAATIYHDCGERWAGDVPFPFKLEDPETAERHAQVEYKMAAEHGIPQYDLTDEEKLWIKFVDRLEAYLFCRMRRPDLAEGPGFIRQNQMCKEYAEELGVADKLEGFWK